MTMQPTLALFDEELPPVSLDPSCCVSKWWEGVERHDWSCPVVQAELNDLAERTAAVRQLVKTTTPVIPTQPTYDQITFDVRGTPTTQGSKNAIPIYRGKGESRVFTGHSALVEAGGARLKAWRTDVKDAAEQYAGRFPRGTGLVVVIYFSMQRPKSAPKKRRTWPVTKPDVDKLIRAVLDSLKDAALYFDDGQVLKVIGEKDYAGFGNGPDHPGARIVVSRVVG